jgi:phosphonate transport system permease protein
MSQEIRDGRIRALKRSRPRSRFLRFSAAFFILLIAASWLSESLRSDDLFTEKNAKNIQRFGAELIPDAVHKNGWTALPGWVADHLNGPILEAIATTLHLSVVAIVIAAIIGMIFIPGASRNLATRHPFTQQDAQDRKHFGWRSLVVLSRGGLIVLRSIPEYIYAFLLLGMLGVNAWPAILALALHNAGILGRLGSEVVENCDPTVPRMLRATGSGRLQILLFGIIPLVLPRFLVYFFYRWETCVREATILGMLGFSSLGYWIIDSRARMNYDDMLLFILFGSALIFIGDIVSALARRWIRVSA